MDEGRQEAKGGAMSDESAIKTELKTCPCCGAVKYYPPKVEDYDFVSSINFDRWGTRPAPELPEGYRADGEIGLICPNGNRFY